MRRSNIGKTLAANRQRKMMPGMSAMKASPAMVPTRPSSPQTIVPGGTAAPMKKGGVAKKAKGGMAAKKPKVGIAIMVAIGKKKGKK